MLRQFKYAEDILIGNSTIGEGYQEQVLSILKGKAFWIWNEKEHEQAYQETGGLCCFNDIVGRPTKDKQEFPLFDYEQLLYDSLLTNEGSFNFKQKHLFVKKATGIVILSLC